MDKIKRHFQNEAKEFEQVIVKLIPFYNEMITALVLAIPFPKNKSIKVIDLGCGTATVSKKIKENFPDAKITCLDMAENMIKISKIKMAKYKGITYCVKNFYDFNFTEKYDLIISSLALHHLLTDKDKKEFYKKIYNGLHKCGVFYIADIVLAGSDYLQKVNMQKWKDFMSKNISVKEINNKWIPKYKVEDRPVSLIKQIKWLENIGFKNIDVIWKYYNFAVYGGSK